VACNFLLAVIRGRYLGGDAGLEAFFAEKLVVIVIPSERGLPQDKV
jgi:hypothetical protein